MNQSAEQFFRATGYLVLRKAVSETFIQAVTDGLAHYVDFESGQAARVNRATQRLGLLSLLQEEKDLLLGIQEVLGPDVSIILNRHNHVTVDAGAVPLRSARMHRDARHWTKPYLTLLIPVVGYSERFASTTLIPSSHLWPTAGSCNGGGYWLDEGPYAEIASQGMQPNLTQGDALLLDPFCFHAAGRGTRHNPRVMLSLAVAPPNDLLEVVPISEALLCGSHKYVGQPDWESS